MAEELEVRRVHRVVLRPAVGALRGRTLRARHALGVRIRRGALLIRRGRTLVHAGRARVGGGIAGLAGGRGASARGPSGWIVLGGRGASTVGLGVASAFGWIRTVVATSGGEGRENEERDGVCRFHDQPRIEFGSQSVIGENPSRFLWVLAFKL